MDPERAAAFRAERRQEERERLEAAVLALTTSEGWQRWVDCRAKFHRYSLHNTYLIALQCPEATYVASYKRWQSMGRQVRKGERGIRILAPMMVRARRERGEHSPGVSHSATIAQSVAAGRRDPLDTDDDARILRFKSVSVFDIGQTDGEPLPEPESEPIEGDSLAHFLPRLEAFAAELGFPIEYRDLSGEPVGGWCRYPASEGEPGEIVVDSSRPANARLRVLAHELAHALGGRSSKFGKEDAEVMVEAAAYIACGALGLDTSGESVPYIAGWGGGKVEALREYAAFIDSIAGRIEKAAGIGREAREAVAA